MEIPTGNWVRTHRSPSSSSGRNSLPSSVKRAAAVGDDGAHLECARLLVDGIADVDDASLVALARAARRRHHHRLPEAHLRQVGLVHVGQHPHGGEIADDEEVDRGVGLTVGHHLAGGDIALDDDTAPRRRHHHGRRGVGPRRDVLELGVAHPEGPQARGGPLALGHRLAVVVAGLTDLLLGDGLDLEQLAREPERGLRALQVGDGLGVIRLRRAQVRAVEHEELVARLDDIAGTGAHLHHAAGRWSMNAHQGLLVELDLAARLEHGCPRPVLGTDRGDARRRSGRRVRLGGRLRRGRGGIPPGAVTACDAEQRNERGENEGEAHASSPKSRRPRPPVDRRRPGSCRARGDTPATSRGRSAGRRESRAG